MTLNQTIARIESLALSHKQINHFFFGDLVEWLANGDLKYPCCFAEINQSEINKADHLTKYNFSIWFLDLIDVDTKTRDNEIEAMSDLTAIAEDMTALLNQAALMDDFTINTSYSLEYFREKFEDMTVAVKLDISVGVDYTSDRCQVPSTDLVFDQTLNNMIVSNYIYTGTGTEGTDITISSLISKTILWLFKGDKLLNPVADPLAVLGVNDFRYTISTGGFEFGTDIENEQIIQILNQNNV
jgi:hypothetical protein